MNPIWKRILGIIMLGIGIAIGFWIKSIHDTGGSFEERIVILAPVLVLYGGFMAVVPDMVMDRGEWGSANAGKKAVNIILILVSVGIGLWLRFGVFADWKSH